MVIEVIPAGNDVNLPGLATTETLTRHVNLNYFSEAVSWEGEARLADADSWRITGKPHQPRKGRFADDLPATRSYISKFLAESGYTLGLEAKGASCTCTGLPDSHAVGGGEIELVSRLHIECRVPCIEVAHRVYPELVGGVYVGHHLMPKVGFTRL
jgi:hypothetical protein